MTEENWIFIIIMTSVAIFGIGLCIGNNVTTKLIRQDLCKAVYRNTNDYINCNVHSLDKVIKKISEG